MLNADDPIGARWARELRARRRARHHVRRTRGGADVVAPPIAVEPERQPFDVDGTRFDVRLPGRFNVANALAAIGVARALGVATPTSARGLPRSRRVPGRMERLPPDGVDVVVDYAHTPDALEQRSAALRETAAGSLAVVFGCGGDRDRGKRREMGATSARLADRVYVTSDNPRSEDPQAIVEEIVAGIGTPARTSIELDRRRAIERAIAEAEPGDVVLVAGKGHETYQIVGNACSIRRRRDRRATRCACAGVAAMNLPLDAAVEATGARRCSTPTFAPGVRCASAPTRGRIEPGDTFVALRGENFDGHDVRARSRARGAAMLVRRSSRRALEGVATMVVADTLRAYMALAALARDAVRRPRAGDHRERRARRPARTFSRSCCARATANASPRRRPTRTTKSA